MNTTRSRLLERLSLARVAGKALPAVPGSDT